MNQRPETENVEGEQSSEPGLGETEQHITIPVISEELAVRKKAVKTGAVRVHKRIQERVEHIELPVLQETVDIQRIIINRVVESPPPVRREGSTIIVPVVEEEIVVTKRLILKEEVHLIRRRTRTRAARDVTVRREEAEVERVDAQGHTLLTQEAHRPLLGVRRRNKIISED